MHALAVTQAIQAPGQPKNATPASPPGGGKSFEDTMKATSQQPVDGESAAVTEDAQNVDPDETDMDLTTDTATSDGTEPASEVTEIDVEVDQDFLIAATELPIAATALPEQEDNDSGDGKFLEKIDRTAKNTVVTSAKNAIPEDIVFAAKTIASGPVLADGVNEKATASTGSPILPAHPNQPKNGPQPITPISPTGNAVEGAIEPGKATGLTKVDATATSSQPPQTRPEGRSLSIPELSNMSKALAAATSPMTSSDGKADLSKFELKELREDRQMSLSWPRQDGRSDTAPAKIEVKPIQPMTSPTGLIMQINAVEAAIEKAGGDASPDSLSFNETTRGRMDGTPTSQTLVNLVQSRAELPANVARQVAEVIHRSGDRGVELRLNPAELGNVKMKMSPAESGLVVSIVAERAETLDLMRRNIEELERALQGIGYDDVSFSFDTGGEAADASNDAESQSTSTPFFLDDTDETDIENGAADIPVSKGRATEQPRALDIRV